MCAVDRQAQGAFGWPLWKSHWCRRLHGIDRQIPKWPCSPENQDEVHLHKPMAMKDRNANECVRISIDRRNWGEIKAGIANVYTDLNMLPAIRSHVDVYAHKQHSKSNCTCTQSFGATPVNTTRLLIRSPSRFILRATVGRAIS